MNGSMVLTAAEVFCPVGLNVIQAASSVMTGISRVEASSLMDDRFEPVTMGLIPEEVTAPLDERIQSQPFITALGARLLRILSPCLQNLSAAGLPLDRMPMLLAGPRERPGEQHPFHDQFFAHLKMQSGVSFMHQESRPILLGRAGFFSALNEAVERLESDNVEHVLIGGVDSLFDPVVIARYLSENRIMREGVMDGFTPGEGAALMVISRPSAAERLNLAPLAVLKGLGLGKEEGHRCSDRPYRGEGLSQAFSELFKGADDKLSPIQTVFAGFNGESFGAKEWSVAFLRNQERFSETYQIEHPAECFGDARAALAPIMTAVGAFGLSRNIWDDPLLVWASSDNAERGAALISRAAA